MNDVKYRKMAKGMGGGMDFAAGVRRVVVIMEHTTKSGEPKIVKSCSLPLTVSHVVHRIISDPCVLDVAPDGPHLIKLAPGSSRARRNRRPGQQSCLLPRP